MREPVLREKPSGMDSVCAGMFNEEVRSRLAGYGKSSRGIVFAGPPRSGKTTILNWFMENAYEPSAEILVSQSTDELHSSRTGTVFRHHGEELCEENSFRPDVFVAGEAEDGSFRNALAYAGAGCRAATTIHASSAADAVDRMTALAMRDYGDITCDEAGKMVCAFQTVVYVDGFEVCGIAEITGYDREKGKVVCRTVCGDPGITDK